MTEPLLTVDEVASLVKLGPEAVRRACRRGDLVASRVGGRLRIQPAAVDAWLEAATVKPSLTEPAVPRRSALPRATRTDSLRDFMEQHLPAA